MTTLVSDQSQDSLSFVFCVGILWPRKFPHHARWEDEGIVPRDVWLKAGAAGLLGFNLPEDVGGAGITDYRFNDVFVPYVAQLATDEQLQRWGPGLCAGELIGAIAMTEPGAGSDLQGIRTKAKLYGDGWKVTGQKTFISNGINSDLVIVVARTDPAAGSRGISLLVVERGMEGFIRGRNLDKVPRLGPDSTRSWRAQRRRRRDGQVVAH